MSCTLKVVAIGGRGESVAGMRPVSEAQPARGAELYITKSEAERLLEEAHRRAYALGQKSVSESTVTVESH